MSAVANIAQLRQWLSAARIDLTDEKRAQADIEALLVAHDVAHKREHRLSSADIPDFWLPWGDARFGTVLEVKMNRSRPADIRMQLERYAKHDCVRALCLVSNRAVVLPWGLNGKPVTFISLGQAWL